MALTRQQLAAVHVAAKTLGLDEDVYRDVLESAAGVRSASDLTPETFRRVMARFEELGFRGTNHRVRQRRRTPVGEIVTPAQQGLLTHLYSQLGMDTLTRQRGFNQRVCGRAWPQTTAQANKVIEALKAMARRGYDPGPDRHP